MNGPAILEIGFMPYLSVYFPEQSKFVDTRLRWKNVRKYEKFEQNILYFIISITKMFATLFYFSWLQKYDVVICRSLGPVAVPNQSKLKYYSYAAMGVVFKNLVLFASRGNRVKLVVVDLTDELTINSRDKVFLQKSDLYFKRELALNYLNSFEQIFSKGECIGGFRSSKFVQDFLQKMRPIPLGINEEVIGDSIGKDEKIYDLFYSGGDQSLPLREEIKSALTGLRQKGWRIFSPTERLSESDFQKCIRRSRFCVSPSGAGWDCYRHYEIAAFGSIPIFNFRTIQAYKPPRHGLECFYFDPQDNLIQVLESFLTTSEEKVEEMAQSSKLHLKSHHTFSAIAKYLMLEINKIMS